MCLFRSETIQCVSTSHHYSEMKPTYPGCKRCHLVPRPSFELNVSGVAAKASRSNLLKGPLYLGSITRSLRNRFLLQMTSWEEVGTVYILDILASFLDSWRRWRYVVHLYIRSMGVHYWLPTKLYWYLSCQKPDMVKAGLPARKSEQLPQGLKSPEAS